MFEDLLDSNLKVEVMMHLALENPDSPSDALEEFVEEGEFEDLPILIGDVSDPADFIEECHACGYHGFLIRFGTPTKNYVKGRLGCSFSWSSYYLKWIYADTLDEAVRKAVKWTEKMDEVDRSKT